MIKTDLVLTFSTLCYLSYLLSLMKHLELHLNCLKGAIQEALIAWLIDWLMNQAMTPTLWPLYNDGLAQRHPLPLCSEVDMMQWIFILLIKSWFYFEIQQQILVKASQNIPNPKACKQFYLYGQHFLRRGEFNPIYATLIALRPSPPLAQFSTRFAKVSSL